jgi:hypothetical protein
MSTFEKVGNNVIYTDDGGRKTIRVYYPNVTAPVTASREELIEELSSNFFDSASEVEIPSFISVNGSGSIAVGARSVSIFNIGSSSGSVLGTPLPKKTLVEFDAAEQNTLTAITYDATGTTFLIAETR